MQKYLLILGIWALAGCVKPPERPISHNTYEGLWVICEGNYGMGNGTIGILNPQGQYASDAFFQKNGFALGDVVQSVTQWNQEYFIVVNNSGKIVVVDSSLKHLRTFTGFLSPRKIYIIHDQLAYVTDLYANVIKAIHPKTGEILASIPLMGWTEDMIKIGKHIWISNETRDYVYRIDWTQHRITDSLRVPQGGNSFAVDAMGRLWLACLGDSLKNLKGGLVLIDPLNPSVIQTLQPWYASDLCANFSKDTLYFHSGDIYQIPVMNLVPKSIPKQGKHTWYGLTAGPSPGEWWACDAADYNRQGWLFHGYHGTWKDSIQVGIIPSGVYLR